jgi:pyrroline-5-carboxylate reductase
MVKEKKISIIGTGNMGKAIVRGLVESKASVPQNIICSDISDDLLESVKSKYGVLTTKNNIHAIKASEIVIYSVKPQILGSVLKETASCLDMSRLIISVAAGVPLAAIQSCVNKKLRVIRAMPNIACFVNEGATAIAAGENTYKDDIRIARAVFDSTGKTIFIQEILMDSVTGLSGSGPSYIFLIIDAMADAGVKMGLSRKDALFLSGQTILGAAKIFMETGEHPGQLKDKVTSPGGTSIAGIHALEKGRLRDTLINAVQAATNRSKELGEIMIKNFSDN